MSRDTGSFLFTYGTLMSIATGDLGAAERALLSKLARRVGTGSIGGRMLDAGVWPAVVETRLPLWRAHGEAWLLPPGCDDLLEVLDRYEGCAVGSPRPFSYVRCRRRVRLDGGGTVPAWTYLWCGPRAGLAPVPGGRWWPRAGREAALPPAAGLPWAARWRPVRG